MNQDQIDKVDHLKWAIKSRTKNQEGALVLLELFYEYGEQWKTLKWSRAAQELLSVSFSLWRAAFLADKTAKRVDVFADGVEFLEKVIEDNSISYVQDKKCNEWTFNYYTRNARSALETLHRYWPEIAPKYEGKKRNPTQRWDYCQELLDKVVLNFAAEARRLKDARSLVESRKATRSASKMRRKKVRAITLASRENEN
ncbi:MAG: hypothetical protein RL088_2940 [Verrucomicrobiota bacterium]|jgi:hypothetical protein